MSLTDLEPDSLPPPRNPLAAIRRFAQPRAARPLERCDLCSAAIAPEHQHLLEMATRQLTCACDACAVLFGDQRAARYRRVPRNVTTLPDFQMSELEYQSLQVPIGLAFFSYSSAAQQVVGYFPSPGGATESQLPPDAWQQLEAANPILRTLQPDVEALLIYRIRKAREHYLAPIDQCYKLVGLIRANWRGLAGGPRAWEEIERFFQRLHERARPPRGAPHA